MSFETNQRNTQILQYKRTRSALRKKCVKVGPWDPQMVAEGDQQLGRVWVVSPWQLKGPRLRGTQRWVMGGFKVAGDTIRGRWQGWGLKQAGRRRGLQQVGDEDFREALPSNPGPALRHGSVPSYCLPGVDRGPARSQDALLDPTSPDSQPKFLLVERPNPEGGHHGRTLFWKLDLP